MKKFAALTVFLLTSVNVFAAETPDIRARSAVVVEYSTGRVLWERNAKEELPMASTTKIMTAIVTLENADLSDTVEVSALAAAAPRVKMDLAKGEKIPLIGLLYALMLQSSNDAAIAIAEHVGGTVEEFCELMTLKAREIGAYDTVFKTPNGLDAEGHRSTALDLALITRYALQNKKFVEIINEMSYNTISDRRSYDIVNKDLFLTSYDGALGVKTGYTGGAGYCFVGAAERGGMTLITVVLASGWGSAGKERKWTDTRNLMNYGFENYSLRDVTISGELAKIPVLRSKNNQTVSAESKVTKQFPLTDAEYNALRVTAAAPAEITAPVANGQYLGTTKVYAGETYLFETDLTADRAIPRHDLKTSIEKILTEFLKLATDKNFKLTLPEF